MRLTRRIIVLAVIMALAVCCKSRVTADYDGFFTVTVDLEEVNSAIKLSDLVSGVSYIPLETREDVVLGSIDKVLFHEGKYYVLDSEVSETVSCFDRSGKFIFKIDNIGRGPGQSISITDFSVGKDNIYIYDNRGKRISVYSKEGVFVETIPVEFSGMEFHYLNDHFALLANYIPNEVSLRKDRFHNLVIFNARGEPDAVYLPYSDKVRTALLLDGINYTFAGNNGSLLIREPNSERFFNFDNTLEPSYLIDFGNNNHELSRELRETILTSPTQTFEGVRQWITDKGYYEVIMMAENESVFFFGTRWKDNLYYTWYFKKSGEVVSAVRSQADAMSGGNPFPIDNDIDGVMHMNNVGAHGSSFISWTYAAMVSHIEGLNVSSDDNPVLCILNFNK